MLKILTLYDIPLYKYKYSATTFFFNTILNKVKSRLLMLCGHFICVHIFIFEMHADSPKNDNEEEKGSLKMLNTQ